MCTEHQKTIHEIAGRAIFEKLPFFLGLLGWVLCKFELFDFFAYSAYNLLKNHRNDKKYVTVLKIFPRATFLEQFQLSSSIRLDVMLVSR